MSDLVTHYIEIPQEEPFALQTPAIIPVYFSSILIASEIYADLMAHLPTRYFYPRKLLLARLSLKGEISPLT